MFDTRHSELVTGYRFEKNTVPSPIVLLFLLCLVGLTACGGGTGSSQATNSNTTTGQLKISIPPAQAVLGVAYNAVLSVSGGSGAYTFSIASGTLPPGLVLNPSTGSITGTPSALGTYNFVTSVHSSVVPDASTRTNGGGIQQPYGSSPAQIVVSSKQTNGISLSISPSSATIPSQGQQQFTSQVTGSSNTGVTWSASAGTISASGAFTAPKVSSNTTATITASSIGNPSSQASATVTVTPAGALAITSSTLPGGNAGVPYSATLAATGGATPYLWSLAGGTLPSGIQLQASSGAITGISALAGSYPITAKVSDASGKTATVALTLSLSSSSAAGYDGPAELPRVYIQTAIANTPATGSAITVNAGGDLQSALNSASCGDTVQLQAGATFSGIFTFPAKSCDDNHWIVVRTNAADSSLPPEGSRLTPCYAGVSSLAGRPSFGCSSTKNVLAKLLMTQVGSGPVVFASGANHYRLIGLELTRQAGTGVVTALASITSGATANNLVLDRVWLHGTPQDETTRGVQLGGGTYVSVVDSFFTDFHCISRTGGCTDSQAINGGIGDNPMGPYKIVDNFLEAAGENILLGGAEGTQVPADIEVSRNHMFKPMTWMQGQPGYVGGADGSPFIVKNLFEMKNGARVLLDSNLMEDTWGGFSQVGFGILLTPKNQNGTCSICQVTDVTIRYNYIRHTGAGIQIGNGPTGGGALPTDGGRYSIHDVVFDDIDGTTYAGTDLFVQVSTGDGAPALHDVNINHITAFPKLTSFLIGDVLSINPAMPNFVFTNSIVNAGLYPVWSTGGDGTANCATHDSPLTTFNACFSSYLWSNNAVVATPSNYPATTWPAHNFFPTAASSVQFVNYNNGNGGDYHLQSTSPYKGAGTDGKDLGADVNAIDSAIAGVQ